MEDYKIELFNTEYNAEFPIFKTLSEQDCSKLAIEISNRFKIPIASLVEMLNSKQTVIEGIDAESNFSLKEILNKLSIKSKPKVYINWHKFDEIDLFNLDDLDKYFNDIWFPIADDIDLFDESMNWIISVRHDGIVSYIKSN